MALNFGSMNQQSMENLGAHQHITRPARSLSLIKRYLDRCGKQFRLPPLSPILGSLKEMIQESIIALWYEFCKMSLMFYGAVPIFGSLINGGGVLMPNHANLINHLVANSISSVGDSSAATAVSGLQVNKSSLVVAVDKGAANATGGSGAVGTIFPTKITMDERSKDNQGGTAPMDLESDLDAEIECVGATSTLLSTLQRPPPETMDPVARANNGGGDSVLMNMMPDAGSYLNGFLNHNNLAMNSGHYMLFPAAGASVTAPTSSSGSVVAAPTGAAPPGTNGLLDTSAILSAAMQQLQQQQRTTFSAYALAETNTTIDANGGKLLSVAKNTGFGGKKCVIFAL